MIKVTQVLYSGLGGHGSVAFTIYESDINKQLFHQMIFIGVENVREEYVLKCKEYNIPYDSILYQSNRKLYSTYLLLKKILKQKPDVVISHSDITALVSPLLMIFGIRVIGVDHQSNARKSFRSWMNMFILNLFSKYQVFLTEYQWLNTQKRKISFFMNFKKTRVINNGINIQLYNTPFFKENKEVKNILMVGRFMDTKDFSTIIKAVEILKRDERNKFHVYFAGDGNTFNTCKKFSDSLNTNSHISFLGMLDESQLIEQYCQTDLYVHSSLAETMSTSIMQALSCGIPCLVSDIPGNLSIIKDNENGWLFKTQNAEDLAEKISNLLVNKELMSEMSLKARKYAEDHLSMERMFDKYYKLVK